MEIREIASLAKLATNGSILETARLCNLSSGAVHKHLKSLEAEFDTKLYEKHNRTLRLTPAGKFVLPFLKEVLSQREAAVKALSDWKRAPHGVVRVGAGAAFTSTVLPLILKRFRHRFPEVALYVEVGNRDDLIKGLEDGLLDLTFELDYGTQQHSDLAPVATWSAPLNFIAAASRRRGRCTMKELESAPFISYASGSRIEAIIQHYFDECRFRPRVVMRSDSAAAIIAMVKDGVGVSMAFLYAVHAELRTGQIRTISVDMPPLMARMSLIKLRSSYTPRALGAFIELTQSMALPCMKLERV